MASRSTGVRAVFFGSHKQPSYIVENYTVPSPDDLREGEILIKVLLATMCPMDLDHIKGEKHVRTPCVLGHEGIGEVIASKRAINNISVVLPGDRVTFAMVDQCGCCCMCKDEMPECCSESKKYGCSSLKEFNGSYSSHMVLKPGTQIVRIPSNVSDIVACPANCALAIMVHAVSFLLSTTRLKHSVAVVQGASLMGLYGCALLHEAGFRQVYCHDIFPERLRLVPKFSGIPVLVEKEYSPEDTEIEPSCAIADVVIDVCGAWDVVPYGISVLRHRGTYLFIGTSHDDRPLDISVDLILKKCITVKGVQGYKPSHLQEAVTFLSETVDRYPYESLVSPPISLHDFHDAVTLASSRRFYRTAVKP